MADNMEVAVVTKDLLDTSLGKRKRLDDEEMPVFANNNANNSANNSANNNANQNDANHKNAANNGKHTQTSEKDEKKKHKNKQKFVYGNYDRYYGYRIADGTVDPRILLLKKEWFQGKRCLDIGCNTGQFTLSVGRCTIFPFQLDLLSL